MNTTIDTFARAIVSALGMGMLAGAALALLVAFAIRILRPSATTQHALWWIVLTATVALPLASATASLGRIEHHVAKSHVAESYTAYTTSANVQTSAASLARAGGTGSQRIASRSTITSGSANSARSEAVPAPTPVDWLAIAVTAFGSTMRYPGIATLLVSMWLLVAALRVGILGYGFVSLMRMKAESVALDDAVLRRLRRFRYSARSGRPVAILVSAEIDVPVAVGFNKPAILLPTLVAEREEIADLDQIVMHEHAHLNRYDDVTNFLQCAFEAIFWFNPVVALVGRQIALQREIACDDSVIAQTGRAHRYATCLWRLVESARLPARRVAAPGALFTPKQITTRIEQLLDSKRNALPRLSPLSAIALATLSAALIFTQVMLAPVIALEDPASPVVAAVPAAPAASAIAARVPRAPHVPLAVPHTRLTALHAPLAPAVPVAHEERVTTPSVSPIAMRALAPIAVPSPAPVAVPLAPSVPAVPALHADLRHLAIIRIASNATPEAIATALIDAAMKRSMIEANRASKLQIVADKARVTASREQTAGLAKAAAAMGTGFGLDVARQISEKLAPLSEWPAIERSLAQAKKSAQLAIADTNLVAASDGASGGNHRSFGAFHKVRIDGSFDVEIRRGSNTSVDFQGDAFVASHTRTEVTGDTLVIDQADGSYTVDHPKEIVVYLPTLEGVEINGSANARVIDASTNRFSVNISGSGDLKASGTTGSADVTIEGSGNADLARVRATSMSIDIDGSGDVSIAAPDTLSVHIEGSGDVRMSGTPKHISSEINGSGEIVKM